MPKFKTRSGGHVTVYYGPAADHVVEIPADGEVETDDEAQVAALKGSPEVVAVGTKKSADSPARTADKTTQKQAKESKPARAEHAERVAATPPAGADKDAPKVR